MAKYIKQYFEMTAELAIAENDLNRKRHYRLGCIGIRSDGAIVKSNNSVSISPNRMTHAEYKVCRKMDKGGEIFVSRVKYDNNEYAMARPCVACQKVSLSKNIEKVFYTINHSDYGVYYPSTDTDRIFKF